MQANTKPLLSGWVSSSALFVLGICDIPLTVGSMQSQGLDPKLGSEIHFTPLRSVRLEIPDE